jgi:DNA-directed RNA polymerase subunit K/omega
MAIKTIDVDVLASQTGNLFESVAILAKRARQISTHSKAELDEKLAYFDGFEPELEDPRFQEEQARISVEYETKPKPNERAIQEMFDGEIYFRNPSEEE